MRLNSGGFYIQDESSGVRVVSEPYLLTEGDLLQVEGWLYLGDSSEFIIRAAKVWQLGHGPAPVPRLVTLADAYAGGYQGQLLAVRGSVLNVNFSSEFDSLSIQSGRNSLRAFYPANHRGLSAFEQIYPGMQVALTGISVPQTADPEFDGYQVRLRSAADLAIRPALAENHASPALPPWAESISALVLAGAVAWMWSSRQQHRRAPPA
jgi:hypothetical protein